MRRTLDILAAASLVACLFAGVFWVRSYFGPTFRVLSRDGSLLIMSLPMTEETLAQGAAGPPNTIGPGERRLLLRMADDASRQHRLLGFGYLGNPLSPKFVVLVIPYWAIVLATAAPPVAWLVIRARGSRRARAGQCVRCGYDLRATPNQCPECGWTVPAPRSPAPAEAA